jgi:hypothetical protein
MMDMRLFFLALLLCSVAFANPGEVEASIDELHIASENASIAAKDMMGDIGITQETCDATTDPLDITIPAAIILLIITAGLAIFYMAGNFFKSPEIIAMSKQEAFELIHTALIVILFFLFYAIVQNIMGVASVGPEDVYDKAMEYSMIMVQKITKDMFWLAIFNTFIYMLYSAPLRMGGALHMAIHFNLGGILKPLVDGVGTMASLLSFAMGEWIVNLIILCYIKKYMLSLILPIGILLKAFPQTRGGGNALIALSIAFFLFYPFMLVVNYQAYQNEYGVLPERSGVESIISDFLGSMGMATVAIYGIFLLGMVKTIPGIIALSWVITNIFDLYTDVVYTVFVLSVFLPLVNIFVTLTFARELAKYFGTEINIAAFAKMV